MESRKHGATPDRSDTGEKSVSACELPLLRGLQDFAYHLKPNVTGTYVRLGPGVVNIAL
jgi:hypothetical protein